MDTLINLVVHTEPAQTIPLNYFPHETVGNIKEVVAKYYCIPLESLHVFFDDVVLQNDWTLGESGVGHLSEIHVFIENNNLMGTGANDSINTQFQVEELLDFLDQKDITTGDFIPGSSNQNATNAMEGVPIIPFSVEQQSNFVNLDDTTSDNFMVVGPSSSPNIASTPEDDPNILFSVEQPLNFVNLDYVTTDNFMGVGSSNQNIANTPEDVPNIQFPVKQQSNFLDEITTDNFMMVGLSSQNKINANNHDCNNNNDNDNIIAGSSNRNTNVHDHNIYNFYHNNNDNAIAPSLRAVNTNDHNYDYNNNYDNVLAPSPLAVKRARTEDETITVMIVSCRGDEQNPKEFGVEVRTKSRVRHLRSRLRSLVNEGFFPDLDLPTESEGYIFVHGNLIMEESRSFGWHNVWDGEYIYIFRALVED